MRKLRLFFFVFPVTAVIMLFAFFGGLAIDRYVYVYAENQRSTSRTCVIIDAGHGGVDGGAISCTGAVESQINLEIALRLNDLLQLLGLQTKMIRTEDVSIYTSGNTIAAKKVSDLKERVKIVNSTENAMLISIHQNFFPDSRYSGAQVFFNGNSPTLAKVLQQNLSQTINSPGKRKAKKGEGIYLLKQVRCPTALIECGFLSNPQEEAKLRSAEYQKKLCCVIGATLSSYIQNATVA